MAQYLTSRDVQKRYKLSRSSLYRYKEDPQIRFPKPIKIGHRILWREADLDAFDQRIAAK
ncbi:helix-turn-helix transcriptional regulator [Rhodovulum sp. FJ3]|uniref:helix-turn-helix transcriptional regulator n=1 Tax=Rhodovulum sp. FJ3 TaxID=3079053 RepID=UPI00397802B8